MMKVVTIRKEILITLQSPSKLLNIFYLRYHCPEIVYISCKFFMLSIYFPYILLKINLILCQKNMCISYTVNLQEIKNHFHISSCYPHEQLCSFEYTVPSFFVNDINVFHFLTEMYYPLLMKLKEMDSSIT